MPAGVDLALGRGEPAENAGDGSVGGGGGELGGGGVGTLSFAAFLNARGTDEAPPPLDDGFRAGGAASAPPAARWPPAPVEVGGGGGAVRSLGNAFESEAVSVAGAFLKD